MRQCLERRREARLKILRECVDPIVERQGLGALLSEPGAETSAECIHAVERHLVELALRHRKEQRDLLAESEAARTAAAQNRADAAPVLDGLRVRSSTIVPKRVNTSSSRNCAYSSRRLSDSAFSAGA